jgi:thioredoxin 1
MGEYTLNITGASWETEVLQYEGLVLVDFWAAWCGPCKLVGPVVDEIAKDYSGKVKVAKVNTDENPDLASRYKIMGIPTLMFIKNGSIADTMVGAVPKGQIQSKLDQLLK